MDDPPPTSPAGPRSDYGDTIYPDAEGPGIEKRDTVDPAPKIGFAFVAIGWIPEAMYRAVFGTGEWGPIVFPVAMPAFFAMIGAFVGIVGILRALETGDKRDFRLSAGVVALGLLRALGVPLWLRLTG